MPPNEFVNDRLKAGESHRKMHTGNKFKNPKTAHRSIFSTSMARCESQDPFSGLKISNYKFLDELEKRGNCENCGKSRKYFCYTCHIAIPEIKGLVPHLPVHPVYKEFTFFIHVINYNFFRPSHAKLM